MNNGPAIVAIIQARMGSTRLPGKVLADVSGKALIDHIVDRVRASANVGKVVVAMTDSPQDDRLETHILERGTAGVFRGSEHDVLDRYYRCAVREHADIVVRVTADDPLKDPAIIDRAVETLLDDPTLDYCSNTLQPTFPEGLDIEVFTFAALARAHREARLASEREHVTPYIWKHTEQFRVANFRHQEDLSAWRWTVDKPEDLEFVRVVFRHFYRTSSVFPFEDVIAFLKEHPEIQAINSGTIRNEGYMKSLREDMV